VAPDARPVGKPQRDVLVVVENRNVHRCPPLAFGGKNSVRAPATAFRGILHRNVAGRLDPNQHGFRDLPRVVFGIIDRLKWVVLAPHQELRRPGLEQGRQHLLSIALFRRAREPVPSTSC
jgi:hypothetical protein